MIIETWNKTRKTSFLTSIIPMGKQLKTAPHTELHIASRIHQGPIPDPDTLARYDAINPGFAERIINMAEREQLYRHEENKKFGATQRAILRSDAISAFTSPYIALIAVIAVLAAGGYAIYLNHPTSGATIITGTVVALAIAFIRSNKSKKTD